MSLIELKNITKSYPLGDGELQILKGINLEIEKGEFVAIVGASGSGKSTLLHLLGCLDKATSGDVFIDGENIAKFNDEIDCQVAFNNLVNDILTLDKKFISFKK